MVESKTNPTIWRMKIRKRVLMVLKTVLSVLNAAYSYTESYLDSCYSINIKMLRISKVNPHSTWLKIRQCDKII